MSILRVNIGLKQNIETLHNGMITWNSLPDTLKGNVSFSVFNNNVGEGVLSVEI